MDQIVDEAKLKRIRANKKSSLTRICNRVDSLIAARASRTLLQQLLGDVDRALDSVVDANESYLTALSEEDEKTKAVEYMSEIEAHRDNTVQKITAYLQSQSVEAPSDRASPNMLTGWPFDHPVLQNGHPVMQIWPSSWKPCRNSF